MTSDSGKRRRGNAGNEDGNESPEEILVDFEAFPPGDGDRNGIKMLLNQLFPESSLDLAGLAEIIVQQSPIGCVFKAADECAAEDCEDAVYGVVSLLDLTSSDPCIVGLRSQLQNLCAKHANASTNQNVLPCLQEGVKTALIFNERFINLPFPIAAPAFKSLKSDLDKSSNELVFDHFLMIIKGNRNGEETLLINSEEEFLEELCPKDRSFSYPIRDVDEEEWQPIRKIILFQRTHLDEFIQKLEDIPS